MPTRAADAMLWAELKQLVNIQSSPADKLLCIAESKTCFGNMQVLGAFILILTTYWVGGIPYFLMVLFKKPVQWLISLHINLYNFLLSVFITVNGWRTL